MSTLPTGTVTFLFTDIEGSTTLWEQDRDVMQHALARHDAILRETIEAHGGHVFKTVGDAFCAAFPRAPDTLAAALAAQHALTTEPWSQECKLRVRMAVHTGIAEERDGDYFGPTLNRVARLLAAGHGGQILLSHVTHDLVRDHLPPDVELRDLGEHMLKDLIRVEHVFQVITLALPSAFPPLRTLDHLPNNLPLQRAPLLGRERELAAVGELLVRGDVGLVTLTGVGGTGKTRLALQVAADLLDRFQHGVWFINLAPLTDAALVIHTIAQTLLVQESATEPLIDTLKRFLHDKQLLLVLDNMEHVIAATPHIADLLAGAGQVKALATSRAPLRLYIEHEYPVPPLEHPDPHRLPSLERLTQYGAVGLFIQRADAVKPGFEVTNANAPAVAEICARLDGLPLAIELAAARVKILPPHALLQRLTHRLTLLTSGARDVPARQQTLRAAIDWSFSLLDADEQFLFARLAVFAGGCTWDTVEAVCNAGDDMAVDPLEGLSSLVDKSLLRAEAESAGDPRFVMFETIREYALERLQKTGTAAQIQHRHARYFLELVTSLASEHNRVNHSNWLTRLEREQDNLRGALAWLLEPAGGAEMALQLCTALVPFWIARDYTSEGRQWLARAITGSNSTPASVDGGVRADALLAGGKLARYQADFPSAHAFDQQSLILYRERGDTQGIANVLYELGALAIDQYDYAQAATSYEASLALQREVGNKRGIALNLQSLGHDVALALGNATRAHILLEESLALFREVEDTEGIGLTLHRLARVALQQGNHTRAKDRNEESLALFQTVGNKRRIAEITGALAEVALAMGDGVQARVYAEQRLAMSQQLEQPWDVANALMLLGYIAFQQEDYARAYTCFTDGLAMYKGLGNTHGIALGLSNLGWIELEHGRDMPAQTYFAQSLAVLRDVSGIGVLPDSLVGVAGVASMRGQATRAARLVGAAEAVAGPLLPADHPEYARCLGFAQAQLTPETWAAAAHEGRGMTRDQAIAYALEEPPDA